LRPASVAIAICASEAISYGQDGAAPGLPNAAEIRRNLSAAQLSAKSIQGEFKIYRAENVNHAALDTDPVKAGLPLIRSGHVWRSEKRFRMDYTLHGGSKKTAAIPQSIAIDQGTVYELSGGTNPDSGILRVLNEGTPSAAGSLRSINKLFIEPIDSLWSISGTPFENYLQRPSTSILPGTAKDGSFVLSISESINAGDIFRLEFERSPGYPFSYGVLSQNQSRLSVRGERRVVSKSSPEGLLPVRVVDVVSIGPEHGYTLAVELNIKRLEDNSPISAPIDVTSFKDVGIGYQVYNVSSSGEEIAERFDRPGANALGNSGQVRFTFLWINGLIVAGIVLLACYRLLWVKRSR
jgi:hypothetical protein